MVRFLALLITVSASFACPGEAAAAVSILSPATHGQAESTVGFSYVFAEEQLRREIAEELDVMNAGLAQAVGDLAGSGSDTLRVTRVGGIGWSEKLTALAGETDPITPTGHTLGLDTVTLGRYGLAKEQSFQDMGLQRAGVRAAVSLAAQRSVIAQSWAATLRELVADVGATFSTSQGTTGVAWDLDSELELIAAFGETNGFDPRRHFPRTLRAPKAYTQFRNSLRNEPGFQGDAQLMQALLGLGGIKEAGGAFNFLGLVNFASHDVPESGGDDVGCAYVPGAIVWCVMSTSAIAEEVGPDAVMVVPEYGIIVTRKTEGGVATGRFDVNCWMGVDNVDPTLCPQYKLLSVT